MQLTYDALKQLALAEGVSVDDVYLPPPHAGSITHLKGYGVFMRIREDLEEPVKVSVAAHLLAHKVLGHTESNEKLSVQWAITLDQEGETCLEPSYRDEATLYQEHVAKVWAADLLIDERDHEEEGRKCQELLAKRLGVSVVLLTIWEQTRTMVNKLYPERPKPWAQKVLESEVSSGTTRRPELSVRLPFDELRAEVPVTEKGRGKRGKSQRPQVVNG